MEGSSGVNADTTNPALRSVSMDVSLTTMAIPKSASIGHPGEGHVRGKLKRIVTNMPPDHASTGHTGAAHENEEQDRTTRVIATFSASNHVKTGQIGAGHENGEQERTQRSPAPG